MTTPHQRPRGARRSIAVPLGIAAVTALALLPQTTATAATPGADGPDLSYVVNVFPGKASSVSAARAIGRAGGTVVIAYDKIGVIVVHSKNPDFARTIRAVRGVESAGATRTAPLAAQSSDDVATQRTLTADEAEKAAAEAAPGQDPLEPLQWDLPAIKADQAHEKSLGSPKVTVGVLDSGVDDTHPDIAPNFDKNASANCLGGVPVQKDDAWRPVAGESDHGMHVAGTIAAAKNGVGVTGVAPGVKVASLKVAEPATGMYYTEAVVCGFMFAADHGVDVTNSSYYTDPWLFNCKTDADQKALVTAVTRATQYAEHKGVVNVAAAGNAKTDLAQDEIVDDSSPDDTTPVTRTIKTKDCFDIPSQLPGVVTVSATGAKGIKSSYSNWGKGVIDIAAPGGDSTAYQTPAPPATSGLILSTLPGGRYGYKAGTSMASPHVAGVAALIRSTHPHATAGQVKALLYAEADATPCTDPYDIDGDGKVDAVCTGSRNSNSFYGAGTADALAAVTK
ncbi:S8 family serine peptidase [Streptomyces sp. VRA16 Mangrove soil]|uniref:S8 family serine peptidase n=1 Tax=Streptomyces sp. VRA16 Mangrove soil TaxID=2817434 RepID=UPI001A9DE2DC|nr:S8 family serine peptidase [Streptomyces sp. VRA16 Mangrove soil]MBO1335181.1 S8 family serine peptidase [Streptomyces sp. VRA16 Mangrove soil]